MVVSFLYTSFRLWGKHTMGGGQTTPSHLKRVKEVHGREEALFDVLSSFAKNVQTTLNKSKVLFKLIMLITFSIQFVLIYSTPSSHPNLDDRDPRLLVNLGK
jgi:hypothetical protein